MRREAGIKYWNNTEILAIRRAALVVADIHQALREAIRPGITTGELDDIAREVLAAHGANKRYGSTRNSGGGSASAG